jgi:hypothetical protein
LRIRKLRGKGWYRRMEISITTKERKMSSHILLNCLKRKGWKELLLNRIK